MRTNLSKLTIGDSFRFTNDTRVFKLIDRKPSSFEYESIKGNTNRRDRGVVSDQVVFLVTNK